MTAKIAYLGPPGSYCHKAAAKYVGSHPLLWDREPDCVCEDGDMSDADQYELVSCPSIPAVFEVVAYGTTDAGVVPGENSWEGSVHQTLDLLAQNEGVMIAGEVTLKIRHALVSRPGVGLKDVTAVLSHPQALWQCSAALDKYCRGVSLIETVSTAEAMRIVSNCQHSWAALGDPAAADRYGLAVLVNGLSDMENNETRFLVIAKRDCPPEEGGKTSLIIEAPDAPGTLCRILEPFGLAGINLTRIESRPARTRLGDYRFYIDLSGSRREAKIKEALGAIGKETVRLRIVGSYPVLTGYDD